MTMNPPPFSVENKTYLVHGLARTGLAAVTWLLERGARVIAKDSDMGRLAHAIEKGAMTCEDLDIPWSTVSALVQSPGIPLTHPLTQEAFSQGVLVCGDVDLFRWSHPHAKIIGITGTNGKSTTTTLIAHILEAAGIPTAIGGNVGVPVLSLPELPQEGIYVFELSSYQLDLSHNLNLDYVGWLNITPDHLERHGTVDAYVQAKLKIFDHLDSFPKTVIAVDDAHSRQIFDRINRHHRDRISSISCLGEADVWVEDGLLREASLREREGLGQGSDTQESIHDLRPYERLSGRHNHQNCAVAYGICRAVGLTPGQIFEGISTFPGLAHRQEWVAEIAMVKFINDSKATNGEAAAKALDTFNNIYWIAGGEPKSDGIEMLAPYFPKIKHAFLIGAAQGRFAQTIGGTASVTLSGDLENAVRQAFEAARDAVKREACCRPVVLLSPACASFDQFRDFEHRGDVFKEFVLRLT